MDSTIIYQKLSDGSEVHAVCFVDGSAKVLIHVESENAAFQLHHALMLYACDATVQS